MNKNTKIYPVILCGGSGSRLWPLSRTKYPKQFVDLGQGNTLFKDTIQRTTDKSIFADPLVICNHAHRFYADTSLQELGIQGTIIIEEEARNTAPAIALAAFKALEDGDIPMLILPADHIIKDQETFCAKIQEALPLVQKNFIVTFGITPATPETGYGYIKQGEKLEGNAYRVGSFVEKPNLENAERMLKEGGFFWNSGMFFTKPSVYLKELEMFEPTMYMACKKAWADKQTDLNFTRPGSSFSDSPSISIDYAVMEKTQQAVLLPLNISWSDLGCWDAFYENAPKNEDNNACTGDVITKDTHGCYIHSTGRLIATIGLQDLAIIETKDAILIMPREKAQDVKLIVEELKKNNRNEYDIHPKVFRPWGNYEGLVQGDRFQVKRIVVNQGEVTSLQMHYHRSEHWVIVSGTAEITLAEETKLYVENQSVYIPQGMSHRIKNPGTIPLVFIEVQSGSYLGEDDIVRLQDNYGRKSDS